MFRILLVEDNPGDVLLFREALKTCGSPCQLTVAEDGHKALTMLEDAGDRPIADLIVLDVNLPKHGGDEVLQRVRRKPSMAEIPVIMLTSSASPADKDRATRLGASLYIEKSSNLDQLFEIGRIVDAFIKRDAEIN
jgi:CheY-like chemotaxis protein